MERSFKRYIKDVTKTQLYKFYVPNFTEQKLKIRKFSLSAIRNYASLRIKLLQNEAITEAEHKVIEALIKSSAKAFLKEYNLGDDNIDKVVEFILPTTLNHIHNLRFNLFTELLELTNRAS